MYRIIFEKKNYVPTYNIIMYHSLVCLYLCFFFFFIVYIHDLKQFLLVGI